MKLWKACSMMIIPITSTGGSCRTEGPPKRRQENVIFIDPTGLELMTARTYTLIWCRNIYIFFGIKGNKNETRLKELSNSKTKQVQ